MTSFSQLFRRDAILRQQLVLPCFNVSPTHMSAAPPCTCELIFFVKILFHEIIIVLSCFLKIIARILKYWFPILGVGILVFTTPRINIFVG
jgi:hypothetical protein